jgi:hypothetical protein
MRILSGRDATRSRALPEYEGYHPIKVAAEVVPTFLVHLIQGTQIPRNSLFHVERFKAI